MAIGERIHFFRLLRGMTQKYLGMALGFPEKSADVRLAQYETGSRTPKTDLTAALAQVLDVSPHALSVPDIDSYVGLITVRHFAGQLPTLCSKMGDCWQSPALTCFHSLNHCLQIASQFHCSRNPDII